MDIEKLNEIILIAWDKVERLKEHADFRSTLMDEVKDKTPVIFSHLYKIYGFGEEKQSTIHHWCSEIVAHFRTFVYKKYKTTKKLMPIKDIESAMKSKYIDAQEFISIEADLYDKYGYSKHSIEELYDLTLKSIKPIVEYLRTLNNNEKPDIDKVVEIVKGICSWI